MPGPTARAAPTHIKDDPVWRAGMVTVGPLFRAAFRIRYAGLEHIPADGAAILAANHVSPLDPIIIPLATSKRGRTIRFLSGSEFFAKPVIGWGLRLMSQIPIRRGAGDWDALEEVAAVIRRGSLAGIFPEGRVSDTGELLPGMKGVARIALAAGVPVIPAGIWGTQSRWPRSGFRWNPPLRTPVGLVVGEAIPAEGNPKSRAEVRALMDRIMNDLGLLAARARRLAVA